MSLVLFVFFLQVLNGREWRSADGIRSFEGDLLRYSPPNLSVIKTNGQRVTFGVELLSPEDKRYCFIAARVLESSFPDIPYEIIQVTNHGALVQELPDKNSFFYNETMFIWGDFKDTAADGEAYRSNIYWAGSHTYTNTSGREVTIRSFAETLDEAVSIWSLRLSQTRRESNSGGKAFEPSVESLTCSGTGFAITDSGYIVTNAHVIESASNIQVRVGGKMFKAIVVTTDEQNDLAIIKVNEATKPLVLNLTETVKLGDEITVGGFPNPTIQGTSLKLTRGVISAMKGIQDDTRHYQIDAAVQPGNSGGPLLTQKGKVVGIVNARLSDAAVFRATGSLPQNVNYAIKVDYLLPLVKEVDGLFDAVKSETAADVLSLGEQLERSTHLILCELKP